MNTPADLTAAIRKLDHDTTTRFMEQVLGALFITIDVNGDDEVILPENEDFISGADFIDAVCSLIPQEIQPFTKP